MFKPNHSLGLNIIEKKQYQVKAQVIIGSKLENKYDLYEEVI